MRVVKNSQVQFGEVDISEIKFNPKSRDDIPKILKGLQFIYVNESVRKEIFNLLENKISPHINKRNGRPGMELWKIFVMGILRLDLNCDYDRLHHIVNHDSLVRKMLGHGIFDTEWHYEMQTIKDNVSLLTSELLDEMNQVIVKAGHILIKKKEKDQLHGRCDSFVVETNVHYPTDVNLLFDAMRKIITLSAKLCEHNELSHWRQHAYNIRHVKRLMRVIQNKKRAQLKTETQNKKFSACVVEAHQKYIDVAQSYLEKSEHVISILENKGFSDMKDALLIESLRNFINHGIRQINQIKRRVILGEIIPHHEKVFSIFQPHTEWVSKGKAGVPVELGVRVCILEDQYQFILHHMIMEKKTDNQVAVPMIDETKKRFSRLSTCSFDKGFHSPENQEALNEKLDVVALKRKGRLSKSARMIEDSDEFRQARYKHSAVESAINALEVHGLDMCPDYGIDGFKRYVALAIVARNIHRIGTILMQQEKKLEEKRKKYFPLDPIQKHAA
jgi:transposase, IS5 family